MASAGTKKLTYLLGNCLPRIVPSVARVRVQRFNFDEYLNMYFKENDVYHAHDPNHICKSGDTVLIQELPQRMSRSIAHKVVEVVYPLGDITDPITGKKVAGIKYRDDIKETNELFGKNEEGFDYDKAPPRGRFEGTRDLTDKKSYKQFIADPDNKHPYAYPK